MRWMVLVVLACVVGCGDDAELASLRARVETLERDKADTAKQVESLRAAVAKPVIMPNEIRCDRLIASEFVLHDTTGKPSAIWRNSSTGPALSLHSPGGQSVVSMIASDDMASVVAHRSDRRMILTSRESGAVMAFAEIGNIQRAALGISPSGLAWMGLKNETNSVVLPQSTGEPPQ